MRKILVLAAMLLLGHFAAGCGIFGGGKTYDGSQEYGAAHPDQVQPMPYMDPENGYSSDNK